ncbi:MAG: hypothetical protein D6759_11555 [Chloroflexi bacterium]|nr:MAG: hypothetical protein D6759_11555 [Chloroflexota bacterium]
MRKVVLSTLGAVAAIVILAGVLVVGSRTSLASPAALAEDGNPYVKFEGTVESRGTALIPGEQWRIGGITVTIGVSTTLDQEHGPVVVGAWVEVEGWQQADGSVLAKEIATRRNPGEQEEVEFKGVIESLPAAPYVGVWRVSGISVTVNATTTINGTPALSRVVEVRANRAADGSLTATKVEVKGTQDENEAEREWKGFIEKLGPGPAPRYEGDWVVGGITVTVDSSTSLNYTGAFTLGDWVEVKAYRQADGSLLAKKVEIKARSEHDQEQADNVEIHGVIQYVTALTGTWPVTWEVANQTIWLTGTTIVDESKGQAAVGAWANVEGDRVGGQVWARKVEIEQAGIGDNSDGDPNNEAEIKGLVTSLTPLIIAGQEVVTDTNTVIQGTLALSVTAEAKGRWVSTPTLHFLASRIEVKSGEGDRHEGESEYEVKGTIASLPAGPDYYGTWTVTTTQGLQRSFEVTTTTQRKFENGNPQVGCWAEARTRLQGGTEVATEVEVKDCGPSDNDGQPGEGEHLEHEGTIEQLGSGPAPRYEGEWIVGGVHVIVTSTTFIDTSEGTPAVGRRADVKATGHNGQWVAYKVEIKEFGGHEGEGHGGMSLGVAATQPGSSAVNVSNTSGHSRKPDLVVRANGDHHLVWEESDGRIYHSWKVKGGTWSLPTPVSTGFHPDMKEANGTLYLVWADDDGTGNYEIYLAQWDDTAKAWGAPQNVSRTSGQSISPDIGADGAGNLHFAWADNTPGYWVIYHGTLAANAPVPSARGQAPHMSVAGDGTVHLVWQDTDLNGVLQVYYSRFDGTSWSTPQDVSHSSRASTVPNITLDGSGNPHMVWEEMQAGGTKDIYYAGWTGSAWSTPMALASTEADSFVPEISFGGGAVHVAWTEAGTATSNPRLLYRKLSGGSWSALITLLSNGTQLGESYIEADANGEVHVTWANYSSTGLVNPTWDWDVYYGAGAVLANRIYLPLVMR